MEGRVKELICWFKGHRWATQTLSSWQRMLGVVACKRCMRCWKLDETKDRSKMCSVSGGGEMQIPFMYEEEDEQ
jgi:hypothetical protein